MDRPPPVIRPIDDGNLNAFGSYLDDHLRDNGRDGTPLFQPQSRGDAWPLSEKLTQFRIGRTTPVGDPQWRRAWAVIDPGGAILGHVDLRAHVDPGTAHRALLGMGVHRDHRRQGLGRALVDFAISWAAGQTTLAWIDLSVLAGNAPAQQLYESVGFRTLVTVADMFRVDGRSVDQTLMTIGLRGKRTATPSFG
jgi:ribosomal protein S18 acetylase RimI-like enzyme